MSNRIALAGLLGLTLLLPVPARGDCPGNRLVNGDAETGDLTGWTDPLGHGFKVWGGSALDPAFEGLWSFHGGLTGDSGPLTNEIRQELDLAPYAVSIDAGQVHSSFSGRARSAEASGSIDNATVLVEFLGGSGAPLAQFTTGLVRPTNSWVAVSDQRTIPVGTRRLRVRLVASRSGGASTDGFFDALCLLLSGGAVDVETGAARSAMSLRIAPNPSPGPVEMSVALPAAGDASLAVYDPLGREVWRASARELGAGRHSVVWDGRGPDGTPAPAGLYFARLTVAGRSTAQRFVRVR